MLDLSRRPHYSLAAVRAYFDLLKGLVLKRWDELGKPEGVMLVGLLREKWDADMKAANGTAAKAQRKVLAQGKKLADLQAAHIRTLAELRRMNLERDALKELLGQVAPGVAKAWALVKQVEERGRPPAPQTLFGGNKGRGAFDDIPQTHETHGD